MKIIDFHIFRFPLRIMRLDLFLKVSRLIVRRSLAQEFCDAGLIKVNNLKAKSSREIKAADEIEIKRHNRLTRVRVLTVPDKKQLARDQAASLYEITGEEKLADDEI